MKSRAALIVLFLAIAASGCLHRGPKPNPAIATETENTFKQRWIAKRMSELQASGTSDPREARRIATDEFHKKYEYVTTAKDPEPISGRVQ